jgi:hypothetical protein
MREAIREALARDPSVFVMGEDVGRYGGCYAVTRGLLDEFGAERVRDTPLSELAFVGAGIGAALGGMRPIVEVMTVNFSLLALDQIVNNAATIPMSGGQFTVPRAPDGDRAGRSARRATSHRSRLVRPHRRAQGAGARHHRGCGGMSGRAAGSEPVLSPSTWRLTTPKGAPTRLPRWISPRRRFAAPEATCR